MRDSVLEFVRQIHSPRNRAQLIAQWDWKYDANPFTRRADPHVLLARADKMIVGLMTALPLRASVGGQEQWVWNAGDVFVHPQYQRRGIASRLLRTSIELEPFGFAWANGAAFQLATRKGFSPGRRIFPWVAPVFLQRNGKPAEITIERLENFDDRFDSLWERAKSSQGVMLVRDRAYLQWRFASRPDAAYIILGAARGDQLLGYLIWRVASRGRWRIGYLVDWLVDRAAADAFVPLVQTALSQMRATGAALASARTTMPQDQQALARVGFREWRWSQPEYLTTRVNVKGLDGQITSDPHEWRVTMGDGDMEMSL